MVLHEIDVVEEVEDAEDEDREGQEEEEEEVLGHGLEEPEVEVDTYSEPVELRLLSRRTQTSVLPCARPLHDFPQLVPLSLQV